MIDHCPICRENLYKSINESEFGDYDVCCPRCGGYTVSVDCVSFINSIVWNKRPIIYQSSFILYKDNDITSKAVAISYYVRKRSIYSKGNFNLTMEDVQRIADNPILPNVPQQIDNFFLWIGGFPNGFGHNIVVNETDACGVVGCDSPVAIREIIRYSIENGLLINGSIPPAPRADGSYGQFVLIITIDGWKKISEIRHSSSFGTQAFIAMKFGDDELNEILNKYIRKAVRETGFSLLRLDDRPIAGSIDDRLRVEIRRSRFVLADLTHANLGAYWEAGFAEGVGKPVIYLCKKEIFNDHIKKPHFDTNHHLTVVWDKNDCESFAQRLKDTIRATIPDALQTDEASLI